MSKKILKSLIKKVLAESNITEAKKVCCKCNGKVKTYKNRCPKSCPEVSCKGAPTQGPVAEEKNVISQADGDEICQMHGYDSMVPNSLDCSSTPCTITCATGNTTQTVAYKTSKKPMKKGIKEAEMTADNTSFKIKVDVSNKQSETKLGIRIQLEPKGGMLEPDVRDKLEATIMKKLNTSLGQYDIQVSKDTDVPREDILGFFIPLSQIKNMIVKSVKGPGVNNQMGPTAPPRPTPPQAPRPTPTPPPKPQPTGDKDDVNEMILKEMRVRDLKEISSVVMKEDFYTFINAGNNVLRTLEENGLTHINGKKYLEYLVKHNIM